MKIISRVSLILNFGLAAGVICLLAHGRNASSKTPTQVPAQDSTAPVAPSASAGPSPSATPVSAESGVKPFRWASIESTNYRTYIANLRGIECPEQTIRDLITADVDGSLYSPRRDQLKVKMEEKIKAAPEGAVFAQDEYQRGLERLKAEEAAFISSLLGAQNPAAPSDAIASEYHPRAPIPPGLPLVFLDVDPASVHLTDAQAAIINDIKQDFLQQVGGLDQDPNDPTYRQRWMPAERQADDMLQGMLGSTFVQNYELHVRQPSDQPAH